MWDTLVSALKDIVGLPGDVGKGAALLAEIYATLTNFRIWRSIGWLVLGVLMAVLGLLIWNRRTIGAIAKAA